MRNTKWLGVFIFALGFSAKANGALIAHYNFDEASGTVANDSVGGVNGTLQGGATFAPGAGIQGGVSA